MGTWFDRILAAAGVVLALFTWLGIAPSDFAAGLPALVPIAYILAGGLVGWGLCRARYGHGRLRRSSEHSDGRVSYDEFAKSFAQAPYVLKAMFKGALVHGAVYISTDDEFGYQEYIHDLQQLMDRRTIRNRITKFTLKDEYRKLFFERPELLDEVTEEDLKQYAVKSEEGTPMYRFSSNSLGWWYYV